MSEAGAGLFYPDSEEEPWPCCEHCNHFDEGSGHSAECATCRIERELEFGE